MILFTSAVHDKYNAHVTYEGVADIESCRFSVTLCSALFSKKKYYDSGVKYVFDVKGFPLCYSKYPYLKYTQAIFLIKNWNPLSVISVNG